MKNLTRKKQRYGLYYMRTMQEVQLQMRKELSEYQKRIKILKKDIQRLGPVPQKKTQLISTVNYFVSLINLITNFADSGMVFYSTEEKEEALAKFYADEVCLDCLCEDVFGNG